MASINPIFTYKDFNPSVESPTFIDPPKVAESRQFEPAHMFTLTDAKIHKILLGFLSVISFSVACLAISKASIILTLFIAIPSLLISGALGWKIHLIKDYQNPKQLEQFRKDAISEDYCYEPFLDIIHKHGLYNMLKFEIPAKEDFQILYFNFLSKLTVNERIEIYEKIMAVAKTLPQIPFVIPPPSDFRKAFEDETRDLTTCQIFQEYDVKKLGDYKIVSDEFIQKYERYRDAVEITKSRLEDLKKWKEENITASYKEVNKKFKNVGSCPPEELLNSGIPGEVLSQLRFSNSSFEEFDVGHEYDKRKREIKKDLEKVCFEINTDKSYA